MDSHEYAKELAAIAKRLASAPPFEMCHDGLASMYFWSDKERFLAAVKALALGKKEYKGSEFHFIPSGTNLRLIVDRTAVCRKVQEEKWECEPLMSVEEIAQVGSAERDSSEARDAGAEGIPF